MDLEKLKQRKADLDASDTQISNQWQIIQGHKAEVQYWIGELEKAVAVPEELPVE